MSKYYRKALYKTRTVKVGLAIVYKVLQSASLFQVQDALMKPEYAIAFCDAQRWIAQQAGGKALDEVGLDSGMILGDSNE